jgi:hypothetical protein
VNDIRQFKQASLFAEHDSLSRYVEMELVAVAILRGLAAVAWAVSIGAALGNEARCAEATLLALVPLVALWLADVYVSYVGVIYKIRRRQVREWLDGFPAASEKLLAEIRTPANPFDGLGRSEKVGALRDALTSPAVFLVYGLLGVASLVACSL